MLILPKNFRGKRIGVSLIIVTEYPGEAFKSDLKYVLKYVIQCN